MLINISKTQFRVILKALESPSVTDKQAANLFEWMTYLLENWDLVESSQSRQTLPLNTFVKGNRQ